MFYIPLEAARKALPDRTPLRATVEAWWRASGFSFPEAFRNTKLVGFVSRHIATARYEDLLFIRLCEAAGLTPTWSTYVKDRFIDRSPIKYSYVQPRVVTGFGKGQTPIIQRLRLAQPKLWENHSLDQIKVEEGSINLISWHRELLKAMYPRAVVTDPSDMYTELGSAKGYYPFLLSLAIAHGVFFEDFHGGESGDKLDSFTARVFEPAFYEVTSRFGVEPLIVSLPWWKQLGYYASPELNKTNSWRTHPILGSYSAGGV